MSEDNFKLINVRSIYGQRTRKALVEITIPNNTGIQENTDLIIRIPRRDALELALNILHASEASLVDAFLIEFMQQGESPFSDEDAYKLISAFRAYRNKTREHER
jgi:hypothetical protein